MPSSQRERHLALPVLTFLPIASFELWPQQWGRFFVFVQETKNGEKLPQTFDFIHGEDLIHSGKRDFLILSARPLYLDLESCRRSQAEIHARVGV